MPYATQPARPASAPWYLWTGALAVTSATIGGQWDVAWHRSIGRDTFWTPAHMAIYACGLLAAVVCTWFIVQCTWGSNQQLRAASVQVLGLRAPLGVFVAGWGGIAMLTSAPFDNWWHYAYGLDVKIFSPPHALLIIGMRSVAAGMLLLILSALNRASATHAPNRRLLQLLFLYLGGLAVGGQMFFLQGYTFDVMLHRASPYMVLGAAIPMLFAAVSASSGFRWAATACASVYTFFLLAEILILPLFPAHPLLGPVYYPVIHFMPAKFPILLLAPAIALDLLWARNRNLGAPDPDSRPREGRASPTCKPFQTAILSGPLFIATLVAAEWPFATFLMSASSRNRFFGTLYFGYNSRPDSPDRLRQFFFPQHGLPLAVGLCEAAAFAVLSTWIGLLFGRWMRGVQR